MPTPFDHDSDFRALPQEVKDKIVEKFNTLAPEQRQTVMNKINTPMQVRAEEPGLQNVSMTPLTQGEFQKTGEDVSASMMTKSMVNAKIDPYLAATVGTTIAMIPHVVTSLIGPKGSKTAGETAVAATEAVGSSSVMQALKGTGKKEVMALTEKAAELPLKQAAKKELVQTTLKEAGTDIGKAEIELGIDKAHNSAALRRSVINNPDKLSRFADRGAKLAEKGADRLAELASPETLQFYRKTAQDGIGAAGRTLSKEAKAKLYEVNKVFTEAIGLSKEGGAKAFGEASKRYGELQQVINNLPKEFVKQKRVLELALAKAKNLESSQSGIRKAVGYTGGAAASLGLAKTIKDAVTGK